VHDVELGLGAGAGEEQRECGGDRRASWRDSGQVGADCTGCWQVLLAALTARVGHGAEPRRRRHFGLEPTRAIADLTDIT